MKYANVAECFQGEEMESVFEVGCAGGGLLEDLYNNYKNLRVGGIDAHPYDLNSAKELFPDQADNFHVYDAQKSSWPVESESYDIVFSLGTLITIPNVRNAIAEMKRIAKKKVIICEFHDDTKDEFGGYGDQLQPAVPGYPLRLARNWHLLIDGAFTPCATWGQGQGMIIKYEK